MSPKMKNDIQVLTRACLDIFNSEHEQMRGFSTVRLIVLAFVIISDKIITAGRTSLSNSRHLRYVFVAISLP